MVRAPLPLVHGGHKGAVAAYRAHSEAQIILSRGHHEREGDDGRQAVHCKPVKGWPLELGAAGKSARGEEEIVFCG